MTQPTPSKHWRKPVGHWDRLQSHQNHSVMFNMLQTSYYYRIYKQVQLHFWKISNRHAGFLDTVRSWTSTTRKTSTNRRGLFNVREKKQTYETINAHVYFADVFKTSHKRFFVNGSSRSCTWRSKTWQSPRWHPRTLHDYVNCRQHLKCRQRRVCTTVTREIF